jgi:hypothetical protein
MVRRTAIRRHFSFSKTMVPVAVLIVAVVAVPLNASAANSQRSTANAAVFQTVSQAARKLTAQRLDSPGAHAVMPRQSFLPCTFNGASDVLGDVTAGEVLTVSCSGFLANEQVALAEVSPLSVAVDDTQGVNEIDANSLELVNSDGSGNLSTTFSVPSDFTAPDPAAACPPTQIQVNSGLPACLVVVTDMSGNAGGAALVYAGQATAQPAGYQEVASDGGTFSFGTPFYGSEGGVHLAKPIVGVAFDPDTGGYWEVASDGGIFAFGGAPFEGSEGGTHLTKPIVGITADPLTGGYWEVASDGGLFAFGGAPFDGSEGGQPLAKPVVGMAFDSDTGGYWEVASDGGIFSFGGAPFDGSEGGTPLVKPIVGMADDPLTGGYWEVASDGGLFAFGGAPFDGSEGGHALTKPIVAMAPAVLE